MLEFYLSIDCSVSPRLTFFIVLAKLSILTSYVFENGGSGMIMLLVSCEVSVYSGVEKAAGIVSLMKVMFLPFWLLEGVKKVLPFLLLRW